jgi:UDP-N-acetylglucosamine 4,6-dehydratase (inverting)
MKKKINGKTIFITGGTGSFGNAMTNMLLKKYKPKKIIIFSRDELKQYEMKNSISPKYLKIMRFFIGDIRDLSRLKTAMRNVDLVIHAAALKHVPIAEYNPVEFVKTNILGSQNVIDAAIESSVSRVIALSTDKAAAPINLYGATKLTADKLFVAANNVAGDKKTIFSVVRYGNVMNSRGSVLPLFLNQSKKDFFTVTDKEMTRFTITLEEGVNLVLKTLDTMIGGEIVVPKIPSFRIVDLTKAIDSKKNILITGIRPGEKIHEEMITTSDSLNTVEFKTFYIIMPNSEFISLEKIKEYKVFIKKNGAKKVKKNFCYNSQNNKNFLSIKEIEKLIVSTTKR